MTAIAIVVRVKTTNDSNGNPRRGLLVYRPGGEYLGFAPEFGVGERQTLEEVVTRLYDGIPWGRPASGHVLQAGDLEVTPRQYRALDRDRFPLAGSGITA